MSQKSISISLIHFELSKNKNRIYQNLLDIVTVMLRVKFITLNAH